ncbi:MAG: arylsulfatase, partial [bacterium]|nr:arylsulfatase [bacterium]
MPKQSRRSFLSGVGVASVVAGCSRAPAAPNVVLLITDDQGYGDLGCHGNPVLRTPNLDRFHDDSVRFTDFHVDPLCAPTRAGLLTGRYAYRTGVTAAYAGRSILRRDEKTMADILAGGGYRNGLFGKWHLGDNWPYRPNERGFDETVACWSGGVTQAADWWGNDYFDDTYYRNNVPEKFNGYCTDVFFDEGLRFIERNADRPFFLYLPTNAPHAPYWVDKKYSRPYAEQGVDEPRASFYGMITNIDENFARLRGKLQELGIEDNTILIFMTDNGSSAGWRDGNNAGMRAGKGSNYDGGHRVPFFIRWPAGRIGGGRDIGRLA